MKTERERYSFIDGIRGLAIVNMVIFHFLYDVFIIYGRDPGWYAKMAIHVWQQGICWTFILISGVVWTFGAEHALRRSLFLNGCGAVISLVTWLVIPSEAVWFGILNFIGCAVLLVFLFHRWLQKIPALPGCMVSFFLFLLFRNVQFGFLGIGNLRLVLPEWLYSVKIFTILGFPYAGFVSSDYFPMLPWIFLYVTGYFAGTYMFSYRFCQKIARRQMPFLSRLGRLSIWIYLLHQPACMLVCMFLFP